jgi:hypothetical protein
MSFLGPVPWVMILDFRSDLPENPACRLTGLLLFLSTGAALRYLSLFLLTVQNASGVLVMRYIQTRGGDLFLATSAVVMTEVIKMAVSLLVLLVQEEGAVGPWGRQLYSDLLRQPLDCLKVSVPAFVYTIQNNLLYVAIAHLDAATFQVCTLYVCRVCVCMCIGYVAM